MQGEEGCRVCGNPYIEMAHLVPRASDPRRTKSVAYVEPDNIVPLCKTHHVAFDSHALDLLPYLSLEEQAHVVSKVGIVRALKRLGQDA